jgi:cytoskeletal protein CcmA (bactofilin family)
VALLVSLLLVLSIVPGVAAAETRSGGAIVVERGETVNGDLEAFGGSVVVRGTVTGDVSAFAGDVRIEGRVGGNVEAAAGNVVVGRDATIGGNLQASAGSVRIAGTVGGNVEAAAETLTLAEGASVGGNLQAGAETVRLADGSSVAGNVRYGGDIDRADGAQVGGSVTRDEGLVVNGPVVGDLPRIPAWVGTVYGFLVNAALGVLLLAAFPAFSRRVTDRATDSPLRSGGVGLLTLLVVPFVLVVLAITIIGIPLSVIGFLLTLLAAWVGAVYGRIAIGDWLLARADVTNRWLALLVGLVVVGVGVRIPVVGGVVEFLVFLLGFGALAGTLYRTYRERNRDLPGGSELADETDESDGGPRPA